MTIPPRNGQSILHEMNARSREIFRHIVESYVSTGEPVGSRTLSRHPTLNVSPATIRNAMSDLEELGLLYAPHTSAGRLPTELGLRLFVDGLLEMGQLSPNERAEIDLKTQATGRNFGAVFQEASNMLSSLSNCAGLVVAPKADTPLRHIEFVPLSAGRALVILVSEGGIVENRVIETPLGLPSSALVQASNYLSARLVGRSLEEAQTEIQAELAKQQAELDSLTQKVVEAGLATPGNDGKEPVLIVRGHSNLLDDIAKLEDLEHIRLLFSALETKENILKLLGAAEEGKGVQIFIGSQTELFGLSGCSMILSSYTNSDQKIVGAIGVIGPLRMNYGHLVPMVDYTAQVMGRLLG